MAEETLLTREGYNKLKEEYEQMVSVERKAVADRIKEARAFGDISENAEYDAAKNEQAELEEKIARYEQMLKNVRIIDEGRVSRSKINVGSRVEVKDTASGKEKVFAIVGTTEADPFNGLISNESAVGAALIGHKTGDVVDIDTPNGKLEYEVVKTGKYDPDKPLV